MRTTKTLRAIIYVTLIVNSSFAASNEIAENNNNDSDSLVSNPVLEVIEVTAQKRSESIQEVPISVQAVTGDMLENSEINDFEDIVHISPSVSLQDNLSPFQKSIYIRGTGTTINSATVESSVSTVVDGVVMARQGQFFTDLADVQRIEILRGPQSTLFGKNASAGVLNIVTKEPNFDETEGSGSVSYDEYGEWNAKGTLSGPISDDMAFRLSGNYKYVENNHITNVNSIGPSLDGEEAIGLRGKLKWELSDNVDVTLIGDYSESSAPSGVRVFRSISDAAIEASSINATEDVVPGESNRKVNINDSNQYDINDWGVSAHIDWWLDDHQVIAISAYRNWQIDDQLDIDSTGVTVPVSAYVDVGTPSFRGIVDTTKDTEQISQELRIQSTHDAKLQYVLGTYLWHTNYDGVDKERRTVCYDLIGARPVYSTCEGVAYPAALIASQSYNQLTDVSTNYYALFGQMDYTFNDKLSLSLGLRAQRDEFKWNVEQLGVLEEGDVPEERYLGKGEVTYSEMTGKVSLQYQLASGANSYFSYSRGYKGPGADFALPDSAPLEPEYMNAYEFGYKAQWFNRRLNVSSAVFWQEFINTQVSYFDEEDVVFRPTNAGETHQKGVEIDAMLAVTSNVTFNTGITWLDATYEEYSVACYTNDPTPSCSESGVKDVSGEVTTFSPEWKVVSGLRYESDPLDNGVVWFLQTNYRWQSETQYDANQNPSTIQKPYGIADVFIGFNSSSNKYSVSFYVKNVFDTPYVNNLAAFSDATGYGESVIQFVPKTADRLIGGTVSVQF